MEVIESFRVRIRGVRPLLMHSPLSLMEGEGGRKRGVRPDPREDAEKALYRDPKTGRISVPAYAIKAAIRDASRDFKVPGKGRRKFTNYVKAGIIIEPEWIPLETGDKDPEEAWEIDLRPVVVQKSRIIRARPRFDEWSLEFTVRIVDPIITPEYLKEFIIAAGKYHGLLDFRPEFGLFKLEKFEKEE